jgi:hypothetical protein
MAQQKKVKKKTKDRKNTDLEQSERFRQTARLLNADETGVVFERALEALLPVKTKPSGRTSPKRK